MWGCGQGFRTDQKKIIFYYLMSSGARFESFQDPLLFFFFLHLQLLDRRPDLRGSARSSAPTSTTALALCHSKSAHIRIGGELNESNNVECVRTYERCRRGWKKMSPLFPGWRRLSCSLCGGVGHILWRFLCL